MITLIITNYNGLSILEKSLPVFKKAYENKVNKISEIILVDDASTDGSLQFVREHYQEIKIIKHKINRGYSSTVNTGVRMAKGNLVAILNNDVHPSIDFLQKAFSHFSDDKVFGVSLHEKGYGGARGFFRNGFIEHSSKKETNVSESTFWVSGGSGIWRRNVWVKLGGFDEKLLNPFYWEDIDLCYRAQKRGYVLIWEPNSLVNHSHESTIGKLNSFWVSTIKERNQLIVVWKNITSKALFNKHLVAIFKRCLRHPGYIRIVLLAILRFKQINKSRRLEKKESKVSDEAIFQRFL